MLPLEPYDSTVDVSLAQTIPSRWYTDPQVYDLEITSIFGRNWIWAGRRELVADPSSFMTQRIGREPLLIARDKEGELRAMSNICRHRAARIETRAHGNADRFRCHYHNWSYNLSGKVAGRPEFPKECKKNSAERLPTFQADEWGPFTFVRLENGSNQLLDVVRNITEASPALLTNHYKFHSRKTYRINCNWKVFIDNYMDGGYHIKTVHPDLARVVDEDSYETQTYPLSALQLSPLQATDDAKGGKDLNELRTGAAAQYWWLFPNLMLNIYEKAMDVNIVVPVDANTCDVIFDFYFTEEMLAKSPEACLQSIAIADQVQAEDIAICEEVQSNLKSTYFDTGPFCPKREAGGYLFHQLVARTLQSDSQN